jgi:AbrB family looped-hinge helix DNA binding protein
MLGPHPWEERHGGRYCRKIGQRPRDPYPADIAESIGLREGDEVELELRDGDILIRRQSARKRAEAAVAEIIAERENYSLRGISIRELIDEGRRY